MFSADVSLLVTQWYSKFHRDIFPRRGKSLSIDGKRNLLQLCVLYVHISARDCDCAAKLRSTWDISIYVELVIRFSVRLDVHDFQSAMSSGDWPFVFRDNCLPKFPTSSMRCDLAKQIARRSREFPLRFVSAARDSVPRRKWRDAHKEAVGRKTGEKRLCRFRDETDVIIRGSNRAAHLRRKWKLTESESFLSRNCCERSSQRCFTASTGRSVTSSHAGTGISLHTLRSHKYIIFRPCENLG